MEIARLTQHDSGYAKLEFLTLLASRGCLARGRHRQAGGAQGSKLLKALVRFEDPRRNQFGSDPRHIARY